MCNARTVLDEDLAAWDEYFTIFCVIESLPRLGTLISLGYQPAEVATYSSSPLPLSWHDSD
jgi:hypothetical protein